MDTLDKRFQKYLQQKSIQGWLKTMNRERYDETVFAMRQAFMNGAWTQKEMVENHLRPSFPEFSYENRQ